MQGWGEDRFAPSSTVTSHRSSQILDLRFKNTFYSFLKDFSGNSKLLATALISRSLRAFTHSYQLLVINGIAVATVVLESGRDRQFNDKEEIVAAKDEQKKDTAEQKPSGGSRKKWIIFIGVFIFVAVVAGAAAFFFLRGRGDAAEGEDGGEKTHEAAAKKVHAIYPMEPLIVNIHDGEELRYLKVKIEFEISSPEAKAEIDPLLAPMQDAILVLLSGKQMADITTTEGKNKLREEIMASIGKIVPPKIISRVYFTDFVVQ